MRRELFPRRFAIGNMEVRRLEVGELESSAGIYKLFPREGASAAPRGDCVGVGSSGSSYLSCVRLANLKHYVRYSILRRCRGVIFKFPATSGSLSTSGACLACLEFSCPFSPRQANLKRYVRHSGLHRSRGVICLFPATSGSSSTYRALSGLSRNLLPI